MITLNIKRKLNGADGQLDLNVDTKIGMGELVALYGPTGSGKSSILKMLAGLLQPDEGTITAGGRTWFDGAHKINVRPQERDVGMVFQEYSLFPNMTVRGNLEFALKKHEDGKIVDELLHVAGLENLSDKKPHVLSGGQKQRVALARALVRKPTLLLLDEPLSALDREMRSRLQEYILFCHRKFSLTTILVSHDFPEVLKMCGRILVLENGRLSFDGAPSVLLERMGIRR
jgi:molybdate transport system ATP-binding protein